MYRYEQHCPVARAAEVVTEPWTLLVVRELLRGAESRAEIAAGVPRMSERLLTTRLRTLVARGLVEVSDGGTPRRYRLTEAGRGLGGVVDVRMLCTLSGLANAWLGGQSWLEAAHEQTVMFVGPAHAVRAVIACVGVSRYVDASRESA